MGEIITHMGDAAGQLASLSMIIAILAGVACGIILGALPGFGSSQSLALLFPATFAMPADVAVVFFLAIYSAAEYGGSIPAILIRTPGTPASSVTALDGYEMSKKGYPNKALKISLFSGVIGGFTSTVIFLLSGTTIAMIALQFGPGEMFALGVFGLSIIGSFFGKDPMRGFLATGFGLLLGTVGNSGFGGMRFTFDQPFLMEGIPLTVVIIAFLAGPEALRLLVEHRKTIEAQTEVAKSGMEKLLDRFTLEQAKALIPTWIRGSLIGTAIGALPGAGASVGSLLAYSEERRWSKRGKEFGTGLEEALAAPETANNAVVAGTLVPSLTLGIPGSGSAAILLSVLISKGVAPGPLLFHNEPTLIATIFAGLLAINVCLLAVGLVCTRGFSVVSKIPRRILGPFVLLLIVLGTYAEANYSAHVVMVLILSVIAYWFQKIDIPVVPIVLAYVMGPIIESNLARGLTIHAGDVMVLMTRPITLVILALAIITFVYSVVAHRRSRLAAEESAIMDSE